MTEQSEDFVPSAGACMTSLILVLDMTEGVLDQGLREHLEGVLRFVSAAESAALTDRKDPS